MTTRMFSDLEKGFWLFGSPTRIHGCRTIDTARQTLDRLLDQLGSSRPIVLTDPGVRATNFFSRLLPMGTFPIWKLGAEGALEPMEAVLADRRARVADVIIAVGGGSVLDSAKILAACLPSGLSPRELYESDRPPAEMLPLICLPTTFGTGAEVNRYSHVSLPEGKRSFHRPWLTPHAALLVGEVEMPAELRYFTALDAWVHALEALTLRRENSPFQTVLLRGALAIHDRCFGRYVDAPNAELALEMAAASAMGGIGVHNARTGLIHALAGPFAKRTGLTHAPSLLPFVRPVLEHHAEVLADYFDQPAEVLVDRLVTQFVKPGDVWRQEWRFSLDQQDLADMVAECRADTVLPKENPVTIEDTDFETLYRAALGDWLVAG